MSSEFVALKAEDKDKILIQMQAFESQIFFKFPGSEVYKVKALPSGSKKNLICKRPTDLPMSLSKKPVTLNFVINAEVYFMNSVILVDHNRIHFSLEGDILHLARRKDRRLKLPEDYDATFMIKRIGGQMSFVRAQLLDISTEGCKLGMNSAVPDVAADYMIEGRLRVLKKDAIEIQGTVRHKKSPKSGTWKQVFGVKFVGLNQVTNLKLKTLINELQREIFLKVLE